MDDIQVLIAREFLNGTDQTLLKKLLFLLYTILLQTLIRFHILQWLNIVLVLVNGLIFFWPKRLASGVPSNAAGGIALMAAVIFVVMLTHAILLGVALYQKKMTLLWVITLLIIPFSLWFWYFIFKFNKV